MDNNTIGLILQNEKSKFCKWKCKSRGLNTIPKECFRGSFETKINHYKEDVDLCEYCQLSNFINEIQDIAQLNNNDKENK